MKFLIFLTLLFLITITFAQNQVTIYQQNLAVVSITKKVQLKKGINFVPLSEIPQNVSPDSFFIVTNNGSIITEVLYPPTGVWIESPSDMEETLDIFYILKNINWSAYHLLLIDNDQLKFKTNVLIKNNTPSYLQNVKVNLLAGEVSLTEDRFFALKNVDMNVEMSVPKEKSFESLQGYKIYSIPDEISISPNGTKIIPLIDTNIKNALKRYIYEYSKSFDSVFIFWEFDNKKENGLGIPIPEGNINIFVKDQGKTVFLGESPLDNTPEEKKISVLQGIDFDLKGERIVVSSTEKKNGNYVVKESSVKIKLLNAKKENVVIDVIEYLGKGWQIISSNVPAERLDENRALFKVEVKAQSTFTLEYTYKVTYAK